MEIQTALTKIKTASSCGSEIYCACSSIIHKGTQKIWSAFNEAFLRYRNLSGILFCDCHTCTCTYMHMHMHMP